MKQSSRVWNEELNKVLLSYGLKRSEVDQCIYYHKVSDRILILAIYVDEVLIFASEMKLINNVEKALSTKFKMKDLGEATSVLGMRITTNKMAKTIKIDQSQYITDVLARFGMDHCNAMPLNEL